MKKLNIEIKRPEKKSIFSQGKKLLAIFFLQEEKSIMKSKWLLLTVLTSIMLMFASASAATLKTGDTLYPSVKTTWEFSTSPLELRQIQVQGDAPRVLLSRPASVSLKNGKDRKELTGAERIVSQTPQEIVVSRNLAAVGVEAVYRIRARKDMITWKVTLTNRSKTERWVEVALNLPFRAQGGFRYWDGVELHEKVKAALRLPEVVNGLNRQPVAFPLNMLYDKDIGIAAGLHPDVITSYFETRATPSGDLSYISRHVVFPGKTEEVEFVMYVLRPHFGYLDGIHGYYRRFPKHFEVPSDVDPRQVGFLGTAGEDASVTRQGRKGFGQVVEAGAKYVTWDWCQHLYKRAGDWYGHAHLWDWALSKSDLAVKNRQSRRRLNLRRLRTFHQERRNLLSVNDYRCNISTGFYVIDFMEKMLVEKNNWLPYTYEFKGGSAMRSHWAMHYGQAYHVFPWASPWGASLQRDLPLLADDLDLYAVDFDMFGDYSLYRGKLLQHLSGWAWDEKGPFITTALGQKHAAEYVKSVSKGPFRLAVMAGMGSTFPSSFTPDGYITEAGSRNTFPVPYNYHKPYPRGVHGRWHLGHKPLFTFNGGIHNAIGNVVPWRELTPEQLRLIYQLHLEDWVQALLQAGMIPGGRLVRGNEVIARAMPMLLDVQSRGWEPVPAATGQLALRRQRYGAGLNAALVVSNPPRRESLFTGREKVHTRETFDSRYLGDFDVLPVDYEGRSLDFTVSGRRTTFELDVCTRENRIIVFPVGIRTVEPNVFSGSVSSDISVDHISHRFILNAPKATPVRVLVKSPRDYQLEKIVWNGQKTASEGKVQLRKGKNTLEVSFASTIFRVSEEKLLHFPYAKCALAVTLKPGKRENGTAQMIQDYLKVHEPAPSQVGRYWKKPLHLKQLSPKNKNLIWLRSGVGAEERGIVLDEESKILTIAGTDAFDTQQLAWRLLRFLDRKYSPYIGILHFSGSTGLESKKMMSKAKLHGQTIMTWDFNGRPLSTGMFRYGTALKIENPEKISLPADLDSRLNLKGVFGSAVTMAHIWDPEDVLDQKLPETTAPLRDAIPVMDGHLNEAIWKTASKINAFSLLGKTAKPTQATTVRVFHNGKALFLGIVCKKEQMQQLGVNIVERDGPLWGNDSVELFLAPGVKGEAIRYPYYQFTFNAAGTQYDSYGGDKSWNGKWEVATHCGKDFWSTEVRIPFDIMKKSRSKTWRFNVGRTDIASGEISTWSPLLRGFQEPYRFGVLRFGGQ